MKKDKKYLYDKEAVELLGVCTGTLRYWEKAGKIKVYREAQSGYRLYDADDIKTKIESGLVVKHKKNPHSPKIDTNSSSSSTDLNSSKPIPDSLSQLKEEMSFLKVKYKDELSDVITVFKKDLDDIKNKSSEEIKESIVKITDRINSDQIEEITRKIRDTIVKESKEEIMLTIRNYWSNLEL